VHGSIQVAGRQHSIPSRNIKERSPNSPFFSISTNS
jgi:hypothetical protein